MSYKGKKKKIIDTKHKNPFNPMNIPNLFNVEPLRKKKSNRGNSEIISDSSGLKKPTMQQISWFSKNHKEIIKDTVLTSLKKHKSDVLHGSQSLNILIPSNQRKAKDWDIFSKMEQGRAIELEKRLDKKANCDISQVSCHEIPKVSFDKDNGTTAKRLCVVSTPLIHTDNGIDVMRTPKKLDTITHKGIRHESLEGQLEKAKRGLFIPMRSFKSGLDKRRIERELNKKPFGFYSKRVNVKPLISNQRTRTPQQFNDRGVPILSPAPIDTDMDGVPDWRDCNPTNPLEQGKIHALHNPLLS